MDAGDPVPHLVGKFCTDSRQEFILLSDVLGVSMLVDTVNSGVLEGSTDTTIIGPVYVDNPPETPNGANISEGMPGQPLYTECVVRAANGAPIAGARSTSGRLTKKACTTSRSRNSTPDRRNCAPG